MKIKKILFFKQHGHPEFKCIAISFSFHHISAPPLCFPSTLSFTFSSFPLISALNPHPHPPPCHALTENLNPLDFNTFSYSLPISYLPRCLCPDRSVSLSSGECVCSCCPSIYPQVPLTATLRTPGPSLPSFHYQHL